MIIRKIKKDDLESLAKLHIKVFDNSYFSVFYSVPDLIKYFLELIQLNKYSYIFEDRNQIIGYLIGGLRTQEAVDSFMKENRKRILYYILSNPKFIIISLKKTIIKRFGKKLNSIATLRLFLIGVDPSANNRGVGAQLIKKFEEDILTDGYELYGLYVRTNNLKAINFYLNRGFIKEFEKYDLFSFIKKID